MRDTAFTIGERVRALYSVQGMLKGELYQVVGRNIESILGRGYVEYLLRRVSASGSGFAGPLLRISNGFFVLQSADEVKA